MAASTSQIAQVVLRPFAVASLSARMTDRGCRAILSAVCLAGGLAGCHSVPPVPEQYRQQAEASRNSSESDDSWLYNRLSGRDKQAAERPESTIRQTSATEPAADGQQVQNAVLPPPGPGETVLSATALSKSSKSEKKKTDDEDEGGFDLSALDPTKAVKKIKNWAGYGPDEKIAWDAYDKGRRLFDEKKFDDAAKQFDIAAGRWPDSSLEEDALFWRAESLFFGDRYSAAETAYDRLLKKYEYSRYLDKSVARQFAIGHYWEQFDRAEPHWPVTANLTDKKRPLFDTVGHAQKAFEHVRMNDPTGPLADDALMAGANAHYVRGQYVDAKDNYGMLRKEYPKSEHQKYAHLLEMDAALKTYQGPWYDGTALKEVDEIANQTLIRFGPSLGSERDRVIDTKNLVLQDQAEREWVLGQYYERNHHYGAARFYYNSLLRKYPQTRFAEMAKLRVEAISGYPDEPPDPTKKWLDTVLGPVKKR